MMSDEAFEYAKKKLEIERRTVARVVAMYGDVLNAPSCDCSRVMGPNWFFLVKDEEERRKNPNFERVEDVEKRESMLIYRDGRP